MTRTKRIPWTAVLVVCLLTMACGLFALTASMKPAVELGPAPLSQAGSAATTALTIMPPPAAAPLPTAELAPAFTAGELRYLQLLHDQDEFEHEYASDASMVVIGAGMCASIDAGQTVPELIDYLDRRGYTSLAAGWIVGSALQELCVRGGDR